MKTVFVFLGLQLALLSIVLADDKKASLDSLQQALHQHPESDTVRVNILNELGYEFWIVDPVQSVQYGQQALVMAESLGYPLGAALAQRVVGVAHWAQGNYENGLSFLMKSLVQYQSLQDSLGIANVLLNIGLIYSEQRSYEEALAYYEEAYRTFQSLKNTERQLHTAIHIGEVYQAEENYALAQQFFQQALHFSDSINYTYGLGSSYLRLGQLSLATGKLNQALDYCYQALPFQKARENMHGKSLTYYTLGSIERARENYAAAEKHLLHALKKATKVSSRQNRKDIYLELKEVAQATGNYQQALAYFENYHALQDSLLNAEKLREIVRLENRHELEKKEQQLLVQEQSMELMQQEAQMQDFFRNGLLIGIVTLGFIGYLIVSRQRLKIQKNKELLNKNREVFQSRQALDQAELENAQLKQKELAQELEYKNKELTSYTINFIQKNELIEELKVSIQQMKRQAEPEVRQQLTSLSRLVDHNLHIDREWEDFKRHFEEVHKDFFALLKYHCPELSTGELKLCALLKLNMSMKEMANILGISPDSVKTARYRLRKKLGLGREDKLIDFIINLEQNSDNPVVSG
ncbi:tetratricopeptide repeat protein [Tunicatimonas pelagia]|uniref:tetratricopeptide repeat protein n=1 Tax=Tunicatimonas pelagia TaxID=931531 RepID=UPI002665CBC9|nr:tetratricopeptide repeat protein [Tunicatimonas pelagia]WKN43860.1 tetratricopeptide repeat protein [Tunicatimonas pelagia]